MAHLPTGTVTFLFTDIEGSTRLLQELGEGYRAAQDHHQRIIRGAIEAEEGSEIRTEGDSFFVVFRTPARAVRAAVAAQRRLAESVWPSGEPLRVRMGLHTGEGAVGGDDYLGIDVNRAARIAAAGHGGQVLVSDATRVLVEHTLPDGVSIRDLGTHRLKDIQHPEHLHDLTIEGLPADFPPIRTLDAHPPTNLPPQRTSFVGRERELADLADLLAKSRLVTLTGPGGTGKTRLALRAAELQLDRFGDGVFVVGLGAVGDADLVPATMAAALGVREEPSRRLIDSMTAHLRERELMLVLDNFEQVIEAASVVDRMLNAAPRLRVLVTSRVPLRISGEQEYNVRPLPLPDPGQVDDLVVLNRCEAVMLFVERAAAVRPDFRLTPETAPAVAGITARLDGLPLAIELAASRAKVLGPIELLDRLERRLPLLTGGPRDAPERQRTLRAAIGWSHDLLEPEARRLFARLAVFAGGWTLTAAEAVCGPGLETEVLDGLGTLMDHSLVRRGRPRGETRFRMLETIREFAGERLAAAGEEEEIRRRHAWHVVAMSEAAEPGFVSKDRTRLDRVEEEHDNVRAALRWSIDNGEAEPGLRIAGALWRFWQVRSHLAEGRAWIEQLLSLPEAAARTAARARGLDALGSQAYYMRDWDQVRAPYEESLAIFREVGDRSGEARSAYNLAFALLMDGDLQGAKDLLERSREIYGALGESVPVAHGNAALAEVLARQGDLDGAEALVEAAGSTFLAAEDLWGIQYTSGLVAALAIQRGDYKRARSAVAQSLDASEAMGAGGWNAVAVQALAVMEIRGGDPERGVRLAGVADRMRALAGGEPPPSIVLLEDPLEIAKGKLRESRIDALLEEGRAMDMEQGMAFARGDV